MSSLTEITVGPAKADVVGTDNRAIQMAIDALAHRGGGTVRLLPGEYVCSDSVHLRSSVNLVGDGRETVLKVAPLVMSPLKLDADIGQKEITPADASGFREGMGIILFDRAKPNAMPSMPLTVTRVEDGVLHTSDYNVHDINAENGGMVVTYFPLLHGFEIENVEVDGLTLDAAADTTDGLEKVCGGAVYLRRAMHCTIRNVRATNCLGDGIRFGQCQHVTVQDCEAAHNRNYGIHPGSHSPWTAVRGCEIHHNGSDGLYLCWGVREGFFEDNRIYHNGHRIHRNGLSIGHKDTDNLIARNHIYENAKHGICFRIKTEGNGAHRNILRENIIENNGSPEEKVPAALRAEPRYEV